MTVYYLLYFSFLFCYITCKNVMVFRNEKLIRAIIYGLLVCGLIAFRHPSMGIDLGYRGTNGYLSHFQILSSLSFSQIVSLSSYLNYEKGYVFFNWFLGLFGNDYQVLLIACAMLSLIPVAYLFYKESVSLEISYIIYISLQSFLICYSGLRQGISVGICMIAFLFIQKHCLKKFICLVLLATSFHSSAILFLLAYPMYYIKIKREQRWLSILVLFIAFIFKAPLFSVLSRILKSNASVHETGSTTFFIVFCVVYVFCFIFAKNSEKNNGLLNILFVACFCLVFTAVYSTAMRASYCFMNVLPLILPRAINDMDNKYLKAAMLIIVVFSFTVFALNGFYNSTWSMAYPYSFFWN